MNQGSESSDKTEKKKHLQRMHVSVFSPVQEAKALRQRVKVEEEVAEEVVAAASSTLALVAVVAEAAEAVLAKAKKANAYLLNLHQSNTGFRLNHRHSLPQQQV